MNIAILELIIVINFKKIAKLPINLLLCFRCTL